MYALRSGKHLCSRRFSIRSGLLNKNSPTDLLTIDGVINRIVTLNIGLRNFWGSSWGWAPKAAADLLSQGRLDWQVSLSVCLRRWVPIPSDEDKDAVQIMAYANIGALVEGTLKLFLSVWYGHYAKDAEAIRRKGALLGPDIATLDLLRQFFKKRIWLNDPSDNWDPWISYIQNRRNAIHAFKNRDIGTHPDILNDMRNYLRFVRRINQQLPYPDGGYVVLETTEDDFTDYCSDCAAPSL